MATAHLIVSALLRRAGPILLVRERSEETGLGLAGALGGALISVVDRR